MRALSRLHREEHGVSAILVAMSSMALFGMMALVTDLGFLIINRRMIVRSVDSGVLAAAQSYATGEDDPEAMAQADAYASANEGGAIRDAYQALPLGLCNLPEISGLSVGCVTATYHVDQEMIFAPIIGIDDVRSVNWTATGIWGPAGAANPLPLELDLTSLLPCITEAEIGTTCAFWFDNTGSPASSWDVIDLRVPEGWGVAPDASCSDPGQKVREWIEDEDAAPLVELQNPPPTYSCRVTGVNQGNVWGPLEGQVGEIRFFPVNDPAQEIPGTHRKYAIVMFTPMKIEELLSGNEPAAYGSGLQSCEDETWSPTGPGSLVDLDLLTGSQSRPCPAGTDPDVLENLVISKKDKGKTTVYDLGVDYEFDATSHVVTWNRDENVPNVKIEFDWATAGACGVHQPDPNARCLIVSYPGPQVGGSLPGQGPDLPGALQAVGLAK
ncbi:MAG TPA: hypothetical protein VHL78_12210 [Actinomycetota bacterium]|nr:hypothetical protein [Actinomycetota bacterium]